MHAVHLLAAGHAAQTIAGALRQLPQWATLEYFGRVLQSGDREFVCDWAGLSA
jgi:hypothetical protein